jgi:type VI secretion system protein ImpA
MSSPWTLDRSLEELLAPLSLDNPAGIPLKGTEIEEIIEKTGRPIDGKPPRWSLVIETATEALATRGKDLWVVGRLVEALTWQYGFPGLRDGFQLLRGLLKEFWDSLYPAINKEKVGRELNARISAIVWFNEKLPIVIQQIPLTEYERYSWWHWKESQHVDSRPKKEEREALLKEGKISGEQFHKAVESSSWQYYEALYADLQRSREECAQIIQVIHQQFAPEALNRIGIEKAPESPSLSAVKAAIEDGLTLIENIVAEKKEQEPTPVAESSEDLKLPQETTPMGRPAHADGLSLEPHDRADALRRLEAVATYFRRAEPHSPVAYLVERAVRWGKMQNLGEWLQEVIPDKGVLTRVQDTLGVPGGGDSDAGKK